MTSTAVLATADEITDALAALPADAAEIATLFTELDITGQVGECTTCPIANYLRPIVPDGLTVLVSPLGTTLVNDDSESSDYADVENFPHVRAFIAAFDQGQYPQLEQDGRP